MGKNVTGSRGDTSRSNVMQLDEGKVEILKVEGVYFLRICAPD
jgi:hypothetical protein